MSRRKYMKNPTIFKIPITATVVINLEVVADTGLDAEGLINDYIDDDFSNVEISNLHPYLKNGYNVLNNEIVDIFNNSIKIIP